MFTRGRSPNCVKDAAGPVDQEGKIGSSRRELEVWIWTMPQPRMIAMEATIFPRVDLDHLLRHAEKLKVAHPLMLRAIAAAKRKNEPHRRRQDRRLLTLRLLARGPHAINGDPRPALHVGLTQPGGQEMVHMENRVSGLRATIASNSGITKSSTRSTVPIQRSLRGS
jgi:hypothetical protein